MGLDSVTLIAGVTGGVVALVTIVVTLALFLYRRSKKSEKKNSNSKIPDNSENILKANIKVNTVYDNGGVEFPNTNASGTNGIQNVAKGIVTYAIQTKVDRSSEVARDNYSSIKTNQEESSMATYGVVNKGQKINNLNHITNGMKDHGKVSCDTTYDIENSIYNKADFHHETGVGRLKKVFNRPNIETEPIDMYAGNVYDKASITSETEYESSGDVYDRANFHAEPLEKNNRNVYDKANFHPSPHYHHCENEYAKSNSESPYEHFDN
ncbi:hypothetical protein CHS0354_032661 [Potamilus streckersoni]|uniref:Uncharacterized protein n=1 Tax=Potamilus streckersoni TaxID=2493646 RepID=A0AAE0TJ70_9BIVA|nr:hypothetical protein CHS0354_032661 [Potamilus streckersoni]